MNNKHTDRANGFENQKYPGSEMTIKEINNIGGKLEKIIFEGLPATKKFSDAELIMVQFVGAMMCGNLKDQKLIDARITAFCKGLRTYVESYCKYATLKKA